MTQLCSKELNQFHMQRILNLDYDYDFELKINFIYRMNSF